jgi:hypothetical protein
VGSKARGKRGPLPTSGVLVVEEPSVSKRMR